jgi:hypothetical protein
MRAACEKWLLYTVLCYGDVSVCVREQKLPPRVRKMSSTISFFPRRHPSPGLALSLSAELQIHPPLALLFLLLALQRKLPELCVPRFCHLKLMEFSCTPLFKLSKEQNIFYSLETRVALSLMDGSGNKRCLFTKSPRPCFSWATSSSLFCMRIMVFQFLYLLPSLCLKSERLGFSYYGYTFNWLISCVHYNLFCFCSFYLIMFVELKSVKSEMENYFD